MAIEFERGYLIPAVNTDNIDYIKCAIRLAESIRDWHPNAKVCLLTDKEIYHPVFDIIKLLPYGDSDANSKWKLHNDWQCYAGSPFRQTIKLEADMIAASPIDHWWTLFEHKDLVISTGARDFYDQKTSCRTYRKIFDDNDLPDVYNAITYWRISDIAHTFFNMVKWVFNHWSGYKKLLKFPDEMATTDVVYALVAQAIDLEEVTLPNGYGPTIVHLKKDINKLLGHDWTKELIWEFTEPGLRINTMAQWGLVHYHIKEWTNESRNN